ncbi:MAG: glucose 1-dehydrogenase [Dehalococcoidia bacterium]
MFDLTGKVALVTGGNGGIGLGIARGFVQSGAAVVVAARNRDKIERAVEDLKSLGGQALGAECDVNDRSSIKAAIDAGLSEFGGLDIVVNNSGTNRRAPEPQELSPEDWQLVIDTNLTSVHSVSSLAFPHMKERGGGKIINIGSMMSIFGSPYASAYAASKGGVVQYTKSCAVAWMKHNVQVNAILPGWIRTDMTAAFLEMYPERYQLIADRTPAGRWGEPDELAGTAIFLASKASDFVTGVSIPVDGGYSVQ